MEYALKFSLLFLIFCTQNGKISKQGGVVLKSFVVITLSVFMIFGMVAISDRESENNRQEISTISPIRKNLVETVTLYGTIKEEGRQSIYAKENSIVEKVYVKAGEMVKKGDPLMKLRPLDGTSETLPTYRDAEFWAEQLYLDSRMNPEHIRSEVEAVFHRFIISNQTNSTENSCEPYTLYSPIDGMVVSISGKTGDGITEYFPAVIVTDLKKLIVQADASESALRKINLGDTCNITVSALSEQSYSGKINFINPYAHETDLLTGGGTYVTQIHTNIQHDSGVLRPGYQATVKVKVGEQKNMLMIPLDAVAQDPDGTEYVMIWTGKQAYRQDITTGKEVDDFVQVLLGINENHQVIRDINKITFTEGLVLYESA